MEFRTESVMGGKRLAKGLVISCYASQGEALRWQMMLEARSSAGVKTAEAATGVRPMIANKSRTEESAGRGSDVKGTGAPNSCSSHGRHCWGSPISDRPASDHRRRNLTQHKSSLVRLQIQRSTTLDGNGWTPGKRSFGRRAADARVGECWRGWQREPSAYCCLPE